MGRAGAVGADFLSRTDDRYQPGVDMIQRARVEKDTRNRSVYPPGERGESCREGLNLYQLAAAFTPAASASTPGEWSNGTPKSLAEGRRSNNVWRSYTSSELTLEITIDTTSTNTSSERRQATYTGAILLSVLVCVVPANTISAMREETVRKICEIRREASELGIPQVVLFTKIDQACPKVKKNFKNLYKVKSIEQEMKKFSAEVGVPMNCIFPVKNYSEEIKLNDDADSLILNALTNIITFGEDFIRLTSSQS